MCRNLRQLGEGVVGGLHDARVPAGISRVLSRLERMDEAISCRCLMHDVRVARFFSKAGGFECPSVRPKRSPCGTP